MPVTVNFTFNREIRVAKPRRLIRSSDPTTDGDTIIIEQPVRMVSADTPEKGQYAGNPPVSQPKLDKCRARLAGEFYQDLPQQLRAYLLSKLTEGAAQRHISAAMRASEEFDSLIASRLTRPDGAMRSVATIPTGEVIDSYGRMLAYFAPWFTNSQSDPLPPPDDPRRRTFNLDMIANGWAAFFPVYPSLPKNSDLNLAIAEAETAWDEKRGAWSEFGENLLLGYEYRMCIKLAAAENAADGIKDAFQRICVNLETMQEVGLFGFHAVEPWARLWFWHEDRVQARQDLGLPAVED